MLLPYPLTIIKNRELAGENPSELPTSTVTEPPGSTSNELPASTRNAVPTSTIFRNPVASPEALCHRRRRKPPVLCEAEASEAERVGHRVCRCRTKTSFVSTGGRSSDRHFCKVQHDKRKRHAPWYGEATRNEVDLESALRYRQW